METKRKKPIRVGIAGLGGIAKRTHLPVLKMLPEFDVTCGAERDDYQRQRVAGLFGLRETYQDFEDMIGTADLDAVFVCLPASLHTRAVTAALEKGLHVFCEKPMGVNAEDARKMVELAESSRRVLLPGFNLRYVKNFMEAKKIINSGRLGNIVHVNAVFMNPGPYISWDPKSDWYLDQRSGGALYDIGSHIVDLMLHLFPFRVKELSAFEKKGYLPYDATSNVACSFKGEGGLLGTIQIGWRTACEVCSLDLHGTAGSLFVSRRMLTYSHGATDPADRILNLLANISGEFKAVTDKMRLMAKGSDFLEEFRRQADVFRALIMRSTLGQEEAKKVIHVHDTLEGIGKSIHNEGAPVSWHDASWSFGK